jgi:hypothetical protein
VDVADELFLSGVFGGSDEGLDDGLVVSHGWPSRDTVHSPKQHLRDNARRK